MLLKRKDRVYEQSRTKPILCVAKPFAMGAPYHRHFSSGWGALGAPANGPATRGRPYSGKRPNPAGPDRRHIRIPRGGAAESFEARDVTRTRRRPPHLPCLTLKFGSKHGGLVWPPHQSDLLTLLRVQLTPPESSGYLALRCRSCWTGHSNQRSGRFHPEEVRSP